MRSKLEQNVGWILLAVVLIGCLMVLRPFASALLWGGILSYSTWPLYRRLNKFLGGRPTLAAVLLATGMVSLVLVPLVAVGATLTDDVKDLTTATQKWIAEGSLAPPAWVAKLPIVGESASAKWQSVTADNEQLAEAAKRFIEPIGSWLIRMGVSLGTGLFHLSISILIAFLFLRNGPAVAERLGDMLERIAGTRGKRLLQVAGDTARGVVYGILGTALVQGVAAGVGFFIAGVPGAGVLALLIVFVSVIPAGPFLVMAPAALWLFHQGETGWGVFMLIWGVGVSTVDNFVKPWLISQGCNLPLVLIFFGVIGGALTFGAIGVFIGPTLLSVGYRVLEEWVTLSRAVPEHAESAELESVS